MELKNFKGKLVESFVGNMLMLVLNLILPMVLTRLYGVEIFGSYIYGITIVSMSLLLANLGMDMGLLYFIPKTGKKYITSCFVINVLTSAVTMLLLYMFMPKSLNPYIGLVWLLSAEQLFFSIYRARHHIREFFLVKSIIGIGGLMLLSFILYRLNGLNEINIVISAYVAAIVSNIVYATQTKDMFGEFEMHIEFISYSATIILGGVMALLINYIDIVMIEAMMFKSDVAVYKVSAELAQIPSIFLTIVNTVFPPMISKLYHEGKVDEVRKLYEKLTRYLLVVSSIVIGLMMVFWNPILSLYGPEYLNGKMVLFYRGLGQLINASVGSVWYIVIMTGHPRIRFFAILTSAIINIVLNFLLIPIWGIDGAAFASMASTVFINILGFFVVKKIIHSKVYFII